MKFKIREFFEDEFGFLASTLAYYKYVRKNYDYDCDWSYFISIISWKAKRMREHFEKHQILLDWERTAKQLKLVELLADRIEHETDRWRDKYYFKFSQDHKHLEYMIKQDLEYLFSHMTKHMRSWWD